MTITQLVDMAKRIHDAEGWNLGAASTRETRNIFWMRVIGCAYWGHKDYNQYPDRQWHMKDPDGDGGRPHSDDVAVSMPARNFWDCIPGAGGDGYRFEATFEGVLPLDQFVFIPMVPKGGGGDAPKPIPVPPVSVYPYPDENTAGKAFQERVRKAYSDAGRAFPDPNDADAFRHFQRYGFSAHEMPEAQAADKHINELRSDLGLS